MINGLHHTAIATHDIDRIVDFYVGLFGFEVVSRGGWDVGNEAIDALVGLPRSAAKTAMLQVGNCFLEVFEYLSPRGAGRDPDYPVCDTGITHIGLNVTDLDAEYARLTAAGMRFHAPPLSPGRQAPLRAVYGRDPDGNVIELLEVLKSDHPFALAKAPHPQFAEVE
jgi:catechol 2,3-dioxygenase-like lactoylglutathione lyase family enzyme